MKAIAKVLVGLLVMASTQQLSAQIVNPVKWSYGFKKMSATEAVVFIKADIETSWHLYSQHVKEGGPVKTTITFNTSKDFALKGATTEPKPITKREEVFDMEVSYFANSVVFQQKVKLNKPQVQVKGKVEYMVCNDTQCLPPTDQEFTISIK